MEDYTFHQTPSELAKKLVEGIVFETGDVVLEPFRGEGAFYDNFPSTVVPIWAEITAGRNYTDVSDEYDWVVTNPPFRLEDDGKRVNAFWYLLDYYSLRAKKGIAFLGNDSCFSTLTPRRIKILNERGWFIHHITVCSVKKWRGRYFFMELRKSPNSFMSYLEGNF